MKQKLILLTLVIGLTIVSQSSFSLGMGKIQVYSALDEPLQSSIELLISEDEELINLEVKLASSEDYQKVGLDKSFVPSNILVSFDEENPYQINVTSNGPVTEPIVSLLLDVNWNNGRILREFTVLLDPPVYDTISSNVQMNQVAIEPIEETNPETVEPAVIDEQPTVDVVDVTPSIEPIEEETRTYTNEDVAAYEAQNEPELESQPTYSNASSEVLVEAGDTLWRIANDNKVGDLSTQQMMMAIYNNNTSAFIDNNINMLIKGSQLTIPTVEEARSIGFSEAMAQVESHHQSWAPAQQEYSSFQTQNTTTETTAEEPTGLDYGVQLSGNDSDGSDSGQSNSDEGLATEVQAMEEDLYNKDSENTDLKERISELEEIVDLQQDAIEIKDDGLSNLENQLANAEDETVDEMLADANDVVADDIWDGTDSVDLTADETTDELSLAIDSVGTDGLTDDNTDLSVFDSTPDAELVENDAEAGDEVAEGQDGSAAVQAEPESPPKFGGATTEPSFVDTSINWVMDNLKWVLMGLVGLILLIFLPRALRSKGGSDDSNSFLDDIKNPSERVDDNDFADSDSSDYAEDADTKMNQPLDLGDDEDHDDGDDVLAELDKSILFDESSTGDVDAEIEADIEEISETVEDDGFDVDGFLNDEEDSSSVTADHTATLADVSFDDEDESGSESNEDDEAEVDFDDIDLDFDDVIDDVSAEVEDSADDLVTDLEDKTEEVVDEATDALDEIEEEVDEVVEEASDAAEEDEFSFDDDFDFDLDEELEELEQADDTDSSEDEDDAEDADSEDADAEDFNDMLDISDEEAESFEIIDDEEEVGMDEEIDLGLEDLLEDADAVDTKLDLAKAYIDMGDAEGAKNLLNEIFSEGTEEQITEAKKLLDDM